MAECLSLVQHALVSPGIIRKIFVALARRKSLEYRAPWSAHDAVVPVTYLCTCVSVSAVSSVDSRSVLCHENTSSHTFAPT